MEYKKIRKYLSMETDTLINSEEEYKRFEKDVSKLEKFIKLFKKDLIKIEIEKKVEFDNYHVSKHFIYDNYKIHEVFESAAIKS